MGNLLFQEYGAVKTVQLPTDRETGRPRGFGFVEMETDADEDIAIEALNGAEFSGRQLKVNKARPRTDRGYRGLANQNEALKEANAVLFQQIEQAVGEQKLGSWVSADCTSHLNEQDCLMHGCEYDGHCYMPSSEVSLAGKKKRNKRKKKGKKKRKNKNKGDESQDSEEECPEVMCRMYCEHGWLTDEDGCSICQCADAPVTQNAQKSCV